MPDTDTSTLTADLLIAIPRRFPDARVWRQNTGAGVAMDSVRRAIACILAASYKEALGYLRRPMRFGVLGGGDLSGVFPVRFNGQRFGLRLELEIKVGRDKQSEEQQGFESMMRTADAIYIEVRSVEQCIEALKRWEEFGQRAA